MATPSQNGIRRLALMRHGDAGAKPRSGEDRDRALTPRGRAAARAGARRLLEAGFRPTVPLLSSALRVRETWHEMTPVLDGKARPRFEDSLYLANPNSLLLALSLSDDRETDLLLIGHNPGLSILARALCREVAPGVDPAMLLQGMPPAGLLLLHFDLSAWRDLKPGLGRLEFAFQA